MSKGYVETEWDKLSKAEQLELFAKFQKQLYPTQNEDLDDMIDDIRETRFQHGYACVHCGSLSIKRFGKYRGRQRYRCKDCQKAFTDTTATPASGTHYPDKWVQYFKFMIEGWTLTKIAETLEIAVSTAFYWRHKILHAIKSHGFQTLQGIVEADDTFFLESLKGMKGITHRPARKRGGKSKFRGISHEQVSVMVAMDRSGHLLTKAAGRGRITADEIDHVLSPHMEKDNLLCTDSSTSFKAYAKNKGFKHEILNASKGVRVKDGIYHIQSVNSYHKRLKGFLDVFHGISTKYIDNYLYYFQFLEQCKNMKAEQKVRLMVVNACQRINKLTVNQLRTA